MMITWLMYRPRIKLHSNKKVKFKRGKMRQYEIYLRSPFQRGLRIWEMLTADMQRAATKGKFKRMIHLLCV